MVWEKIILVILGALIGFFVNIIIDFNRRIYAKRDLQERRKKLFVAILNEVDEGVNRCHGLVEKLDKDEGSFGRIYTAFWDSMKNEIALYIEDIEVLKLLHSIYYRFDLVNFNMEKNRTGVGAAFAKQYLSEMQANLEMLHERKVT